MLLNPFERVLGILEEHPLRLGEHCFPEVTTKAILLQKNDLLASLMEEGAFLSPSLLFKNH